MPCRPVPPVTNLHIELRASCQLKSFVPEIEENNIKYKYIFGNDKEMKKVVQVLEKISEIRDALLEDNM